MSDIDDATLAHHEGVDTEETLADTPMTETVEVEGMTLAEAAAVEGDVKAPLTGERIQRMVEAEEAKAEAPEQADDIPDDPETAACPQCGGYGQTKTGSLVPDNILRQCPYCTGLGWVERERVHWFEDEQRRKQNEQRE